MVNITSIEYYPKKTEIKN